MTGPGCEFGPVGTVLPALNRLIANYGHPMDVADLVVTAEWVLPVVPQGVHLHDAAIAVKDGVIVAVGPRVEVMDRWQGNDVVELPHHTLIPGLVNAHTHAAMTLLRGYADDLPLGVWLNDHIWPAESTWVDEQFVWDGTNLAIVEMLTSGVTCFNDMYFFPEVAAQAASEVGMRMVAGLICFDFPNNYASGAQECISKGLTLHDQLRDNKLVTTAFAPHAPYTVSDEPLRQIVDLADAIDVPIHMHVCETAQEDPNSIAAYGQTTLNRLKALGLLSPRLVAAHMVHLSDTDIVEVAAAGVSVAHCPESNMKLASGFCRVDALQRAGVNVAIGTDGAASNNDLDMLAEMRVAALLSKAVAGDAGALPADAALYAATMGGAQALGLGQAIGSLSVGKRADIVALSLADWPSVPLHNPASQIVYTASRGHVTDVWVGGVQRVAGGAVIGVDQTGLRQRIRQWADRIGGPAAHGRQPHGR